MKTDTKLKLRRLFMDFDNNNEDRAEYGYLLCNNKGDKPE